MSTKQENKKSFLGFAEKQRLMTKEQVRTQMFVAFIISLVSFVLLVLNYTGVLVIQDQLVVYSLLAILFISCVSIIVHETFNR